MNKNTVAKIASIILFIHGFIEILIVTTLFVPIEFALIWFQGRPTIFWVVISAIYGISRLIASYAIWLMKKWGIVFGMALSIISIIVAPSIYPFGIIDLLLAIIVLVSLLYVWFGDEKL